MSLENAAASDAHVVAFQYAFNISRLFPNLLELDIKCTVNSEIAVAVLGMFL
ncbi:hypothetical protein HDU93_006910, partial [Gonapodya sp. JEL0774]